MILNMKNLIYAIVCLLSMMSFAAIPKDKIGECALDPQCMHKTMSMLSPEDQIKFLAHVNGAIASCPKSEEAKTKMFIDANCIAISCSTFNNHIYILATTYSTVPLIYLEAMTEKLAEYEHNHLAMTGMKLNAVKLENCIDDSDTTTIRIDLARRMIRRVTEYSIEDFMDRMPVVNVADPELVVLVQNELQAGKTNVVLRHYEQSIFENANGSDGGIAEISRVPRDMMHDKNNPNYRKNRSTPRRHVEPGPYWLQRISY